MPVGSFDEGHLIGKVAKVVIGYKEQQVLGFIVKPSGLFAKSKLASIEDVVDIDQAGLVIHSAENLVEPDEVVRIAQILNENFDLIGLSVISREGKSLGKVYNALVDTQTGSISRIYVRQFINDYVFDHTQIDEITLKMVKLRSEKRQRARKHLEALSEPKTI